MGPTQKKSQEYNVVYCFVMLLFCSFFMQVILNHHLASNNAISKSYKSYYVRIKIAEKRLQITEGRKKKLARAKAVITDYIGTLVNANYYNMDASKRTLHKTLLEAGLETSLEDFLEAYTQAHEKYRVVRYKQLREVTNAVWVCEALNNLGCAVSLEDSRIKVALNVFFQRYVESLELRSCTKKLLGKIKEHCKLGLVSNFTYAPVVYASLRKLGINHFFDAILVSDENGWRKPHAQIFQDALGKLQVNAEEAVYIGDSPLEDIKGAQAAGIKTVFVSSQFFSLEDFCESGQKTDFVAQGLDEIFRNFLEIIS
jgi:FMN phosphatase YigB (HAD superfamily)